MESKRITRDDVARQAGVSSATVSYVINNAARPVSAETRKKVLQAIEELGYRPDGVARNLRRQRTSTLGLIVPDTFNPYFAEVAQGVEIVAFERGYVVILCHSNYDLDKEIQYVDVLSSERAAGVIWIPATSSFLPGEHLQAYHIPFVILDRVVGRENILSVVADNFYGGYLATQHLLSLGHQRICCITRPVGLDHSNARLRGYTTALTDHGYSLDECSLVVGGYRFEDGRQAALKILSTPERPTAIFAYNDLMAIGALRASRELGLRVPEDLSVVGFDDIPAAAFTFPPLTSVRQPKLAMGKRAVELLFAAINGENDPFQTQIKLEVELVVRASTGPAPSSSRKN
jgi:LacI family transcriptional regulator